MIKSIIKSLNLPKNEILFLHLRLKGLSYLSYVETTKQIIGYLEEFYKPKTILVPTFSYSFTKTGIYNRSSTRSEVGRFGEEVRNLYHFGHRTMNPVFNVIDTLNYLDLDYLDESTAFGKNSMLDFLNNTGYIIINLNLPQLINTHLHYLEFIENVDYRFEKVFQGEISDDGVNYNSINYMYYVRKLELDTSWRRKKIEDFLIEQKVLIVQDNKNIRSNWVDSRKLSRVIKQQLRKDKTFLITDKL